jgi:hypothetical protein
MNYQREGRTCVDGAGVYQVKFSQLLEAKISVALLNSPGKFTRK